MKKQINCFGFDTNLYYRNHNLVEPYQFVKGDNVVYVRFEEKNPCTVVRIQKDGDVYTQRWAYGDWNDYATLDYDLAINEVREIEAED